MFPLRIPTHLSGTRPRYQNSTCVELELLLLNHFWALLFRSTPPLSEYLQTCQGCNSDRVMVLRKGPNITHETRILEMFKAGVQGPTFLASWSPSASISEGNGEVGEVGEKYSPQAAGDQLMQEKEANMTCSTLNDVFRIYFCTCDRCHRLEIHHLP